MLHTRDRAASAGRLLKVQRPTRVSDLAALSERPNLARESVNDVVNVAPAMQQRRESQIVLGLRVPGNFFKVRRNR